MNVASPSGIVTLLFTDIEGSTRLWAQDRERMSRALAGHDAVARAAVEGHRGVVVKTTGDGMLATFGDPVDAIAATLALLRALADAEAAGGIALSVRCGLHAGVVEHRDHDLFGTTANRAARIMGVAHGGQPLISQAVAVLVRDRLPAGVTLRDLGSVRLRDLASAEHVYQLVHPELRQDFPALRSLAARPNNLPSQVTSFIGRERELAEAGRLLRDSRLLTLTGVGGLGKTRLSLQLAADALDDYADGVWLVELAPLSDARLVPQAVASALGVKEEAGRPTEEALIAQIRDRQQLLLLDNCEHVASACAELVTVLLQTGPQLRVVATSREPLRIAGERIYPVPPLSVPDARKTKDPVELRQFEAVGLFVERAVAVQPDFRLMPRTPRRSPRSAANWTAFLWRSSSRPRACACSR